MGDPVDVQLIIGATKPALLLRAASFAAHKHRDQRRKDARASPYINHPLMLADILASEGSVTDTVTLCAALLHDTIEDTETKPDELRELFGPEIAAVVVEVTDDKTLEKADRKRLQVEHASVISDKAKLVKLADKIANIRDVVSSPPADWSLDRKRDYFDWAKRVIDQLRGVHPQLEAAFDAAYECRP
ncbi:MAG: bifunctional (p)ppGpp synthetase/guanosine-3',5'-bis(diphosphate) 3'-pyrophosphohydrolase [Betaproteobacteria bacterium]|nr:bifunctional (p)ppGpp synthetase/guanosine-3',5'-bis(diphosphate) 3'-pyrophosphohydrolase [Betaproteobacteria bacterium]